MNDTAQSFEFQTEARQLLDLMIHSVYSNKDIFLRELISNSSDALDKLRIESLRGGDVSMSPDPHIRIDVDKVSRTLSVIDDGVGMSRDELIRNIGTIAKSGTKEFLELMRASKDGGNASAELIGQFGVGFYSTFMVADRVTIMTRRAGEEQAWRWESTGDGTYTIEESLRPTHGTTVQLHLKTAGADEALKDYTDEWVIKSIVKKYSDFVTYPIRMRVEKEEIERDETGKPKPGGATTRTEVDETLNSMKALWTRQKEQVTKEEYGEFYRHISHDWNDPLEVITVRAEGTFEYYALLFIPSKAPFDLFMQEGERGLHLYVKRIFILDDAKDLVPMYLRFLRGVVDAEDLPLNISREILQENRQIQLIRKRLTKRTLDTLGELRQRDREKYLTFWREFGAVLKEGTFQDYENREQLLDLALFHSTATGELTSLNDYAGRMKEGQKEIYYITGESRDVLEQSPHLEAFAAKGYEVLILTDPVDEIWTSGDLKYQEKPLKSAARTAAELGSEEERKEAESKRQEGLRQYGAVLMALQEQLEDRVKEVRLSNRLTTSAVCLVADEHSVSPQLEKIMRAMGQEVPKSQRILELNPEHPLLAKLHETFERERNSAALGDYADLLYGQALLAEGSVPSDPARFSRLVADLMVKAAV